jgi:uncharacterized CHY-type Zn-finger protein
LSEEEDDKIDPVSPSLASLKKFLCPLCDHMTKMTITEAYMRFSPCENCGLNGAFLINTSSAHFTRDRLPLIVAERKALLADKRYVKKWEAKNCKKIFAEERRKIKEEELPS